MACGRKCSGMLSKIWERPFWEGDWPYLDPWDSVCSRKASTHWNVPGKYGTHGELFFFLIKKEPVVASNEVLPKPIVSAETLKACALIGLHLLAAEGEDGSSGSQSRDSRDLWRYGCPKKKLAGVAMLRHGQEAKALLHLNISSWKTENLLVLALRGAQSLRIILVPCVRSAKEVLWRNCHSSKAFFSPWTDCDNKGEGCGERYERAGT